MTLPVALQLYSVRDQMEKDFEGTIKAVHDMGYNGVEMAGLYDRPVSSIKALLDELDMPAISAHVSFDEMCADPEHVFGEYKKLGCETIAIPWLDAKVAFAEDAFYKTCEKVKQIGGIAKDCGLTLLYHNHNFEFEKIDGEYLLDRFYRLIPASLLQTQIDTCWVNVGGEDPTAYLLKYKGRAPNVHLKDFYKKGHVKEGLFDLLDSDAKTSKQQKRSEENFSFRPLGEGLQNMPAILDACVQVGPGWVIVEQDESKDRPSMQAAKDSRDYLSSLGW